VRGFVLVLSVLVKEHPRRLSNGVCVCVYIYIYIYIYISLYIYIYISHAYVYERANCSDSGIASGIALALAKVPFDSGYAGVPSVVRSREQQWDVLLYRAKRRNFSLNIVITFTRVSRSLPLPAPPRRSVLSSLGRFIFRSLPSLSLCLASRNFPSRFVAKARDE